MSTVTWLHLSDLHACDKRTGWDAERVLETLQKDLKDLQSRYELHPDLLFFTGDAAYGQIGGGPGETLQDQYSGVQHFLEEVRKSVTPAIPLSNVFLVPGNHDVNRTFVTPDQTSWLDDQRDVAAITDIIQKAGIQWKRYMERLGDYRTFLQTSGCGHLLQDPERLIYAAVREINGISIGVAGLNSVWSCGRDGERGKLWLAGSWQIGQLRRKLREAKFSIVLTHHPASWLVEYEGPQLRFQLEQEFKFHLHGHEHDDWVETNTSGYTRVAAAACYERSNRKNGYNFVRLDLAQGKGEVWLRQYEPKGGGWIPGVIKGKTNNDGVWSLDHLGWLKKQPGIPGQNEKKSAVTLDQHKLDISAAFQVETTILKNIIAEDRVLTMKLRTLKAHQDIKQFAIDLQPIIIPLDESSERRANIANFYSIPGRAARTPGGMFQIDFEDDEILEANKNHAVLLGYTLEEKLEVAFDPPGVIVQQPVGKELLVIEIHFPRGWHFRRGAKGKPEFKLYVKDPNTKQDIDLPLSEKVTVKPLSFDFGGERGETDFFRVRIENPPQDGDVYFDWQWEKTGT